MYHKSFDKFNQKFFKKSFRKCWKKNFKNSTALENAIPKTPLKYSLKKIPIEAWIRVSKYSPSNSTVLPKLIFDSPSPKIRNKKFYQILSFSSTIQDYNIFIVPTVQIKSQKIYSKDPQFQPKKAKIDCKMNPSNIFKDSIKRRLLICSLLYSLYF